MSFYILTHIINRKEILLDLCFYFYVSRSYRLMCVVQFTLIYDKLDLDFFLHLHFLFCLMHDLKY